MLQLQFADTKQMDISGNIFEGFRVGHAPLGPPLSAPLYVI